MKRFLACALAGLILPACGSSDSGSGSQAGPAPVQAGPPPVLAEDFRLVDRNPDSPTHRRKVSPRDALGMVPGFYFGHAN